MFWLNVLEAPPRPKAEDGKNFLQFAVRTRLKILYRPRGLGGNAHEAHKNVQWNIVPHDGGHAIVCANAAAFNLSFGSISPPSGEIVADGGMCPAKGPATFAPKVNSVDGTSITVNEIIDFGGIDRRAVTLKR